MIDAVLVIALLTAITVLAGLASRIGAPYPVVLVLGGLAMGFVPGAPVPELHPDLVLLVFLPPLVYSAAFLSSTVELRAAARPILTLAVGLVLLTVGAVALVAHLVIGLPWAVAFVLGAVLGPTDPVSASAVIRRIGAPERLVTILEGEALANDGTGITTYGIAVAAVGTGSFSLPGALGTFAFAVALGTAIGLATGWLGTRARQLVDDARVETALSLLTPFVAYISAEQLGASGVLAAVAAGLYAGSQAVESSSPGTRLQVSAFWDLLVFLLDAVLFLLIGLQLPRVLEGIGGGLSGVLIGQALVVAATAIAIRLAWMFAVPAVAGALRRGSRTTSIRATAAARLILGWSGMRGGVSLAIALAIPLTVAGGAAFPDRSLVIFLAYATVVITLVGPGLTVGPLLRRLGLEQGRERQRQEARARARVVHAALARIEELAGDEEVPEDVADRLRNMYDARLNRLKAWLHRGALAERDGANARPLRKAALAAQREELAELRAARAFPADLLRDIERDIDLEESRLR